MSETIGDIAIGLSVFALAASVWIQSRETRLLRQDLDHLRQEVRIVLHKTADIRAMHRRAWDDDATVDRDDEYVHGAYICTTCSYPTEWGHRYVEWPCPTIAILDEED